MSVQKIGIMTDSSAYLPDELKAGMDIHVIPLWLIWDNERFQDGVDIEPQSFYQRLKTSKTLPTSSQPSAKEFELFFRECGQECDAIVSVLASSKISGTVDSAEAAKNEMEDLPIRIIDSFSSSMGLGLIVMAAARAAAAGRSIDEVVVAAEDMLDKVDLLFVVDTLEFLHRGGRIGGAKRYLGTALQIKPILHFENGLIEPLSQARTRRKSIAQLLDLVEERLEGRIMAEAAIVHIDCPAEGESLARLVESRFSPSEIHFAEVSPVVGTHVGPGGLGVAFYPKD